MSGDPFRIGSSFGGPAPAHGAGQAAPAAASPPAPPPTQASNSDHVNFSGEVNEHEGTQGAGLTSGLASTWGDAGSVKPDPGFSQSPVQAPGMSHGSTFCSHGSQSGEPGFQAATSFSTPLLS